MAEKKVTKTAAKKTVAKKPAAKKTVVKKAPAKKTVAAKKVAPVVEMPAPEIKPCPCGGNCKCHKGGFFKKFILILIIFALGFASAKLCCCGKKFGKMGPRPEFDNGCLVIKCPKLAKMAPMMDTDHNGCVTKEEFRTAKKHMKKRPARPEMPAPAPQIEVVE